MSRRPGLTSALVLATVCSTGLLALQPAALAAGAPGGGAAPPDGPVPGAQGTPSAGGGQEGVFDIRQGTTRAQQKARAGRSAALQATVPVRALARQLGPQSVIDLDPLTGTPRQVARLDGLLTGPSTAAAIGRRPRLRARPRGRLRAVRYGPRAARACARDYVDIAGIHHLAFVQRVGGVPLFGNGLRGQRHQGRPARQRHRLAGARAPRARATPRAGLSVDAAIPAGASTTSARRRSHRPRGTPASRCCSSTAGGTRRAIQTVTMSAATPSLDVIDAETGRVLYRDLLDAATWPAAAPGPRPARTGPTSSTTTREPPAVAAGRARSSLNRPGWLPKGRSCSSATTSTPTATSTTTTRPTPPRRSARPAGRLPVPAGQDERRRRAVHGLRLHLGPRQRRLLADERRAHRDAELLLHQQVARLPGQGADRLHRGGRQLPAGQRQRARARAATRCTTSRWTAPPSTPALPDLRHIDNANFATPPDGQPPTMQMYLLHEPGASPAQDPFIAAMPARTRRTSSTTSTPTACPTGWSPTPTATRRWTPSRAASMGEAWSDWYALDYLVNQGLDQGQPGTPGDVDVGDVRRRAATTGIRSRADRLPGRLHGRGLPRHQGTGRGRLHLRRLRPDLRRTGDVHAAGEIWAQTLWDLRGALGSRAAPSRW